jgi:thiol-disulfide isomerase/thioredoxin
MNRHLHTLLVLAALVASPFALGAEVPYQPAAFDAARASGQAVAVVFHADWCPTCRAQAPVLKALAATPEFAPVTIYVASFDDEKALEKALGVSHQSTIVVFRKGRETARSTGVTDRAALQAFLHDAIS